MMSRMPADDTVDSGRSLWSAERRASLSTTAVHSPSVLPPSGPMLPVELAAPRQSPQARARRARDLKRLDRIRALEMLDVQLENVESELLSELSGEPSATSVALHAAAATWRGSASPGARPAAAPARASPPVSARRLVGPLTCAASPRRDIRAPPASFVSEDPLVLDASLRTSTQPLSPAAPLAEPHSTVPGSTLPRQLPPWWRQSAATAAVRAAASGPPSVGSAEGLPSRCFNQLSPPQAAVQRARPAARGERDPPFGFRPITDAATYHL